VRERRNIKHRTNTVACKHKSLLRQHETTINPTRDTTRCSFVFTMQQQSGNVFRQFFSSRSLMRHPFFSYVFVFHDRRHKAKELLSRCGLDRRRKFFVLVLLFLFVNSPRMCKRKKKVGNTIAKSLVGGKKALSDG
jgi:hypothetical protein